MVTALKEQCLDAVANGRLEGRPRRSRARLFAEDIDISDREAVNGVISAYNAEQNARRLLEPC